MCKNLFIAGIKPEVSKKKLWDFLIAATPFMTEHDQHGLGYAALGTRGLWGERWLDPSEAWLVRKEWTDKDELVKARFNGSVEGEPKFNTFGIADPDNTYAVIMHARMATCEKGLHNTHPFVSGDTALIHNGIIRNTVQLQNITSTCDSECILNEYTKTDVMNQPDKISKVAAELRGYYACGVLTKNSEGKEFLDIFRSSTADLNACYIKELDAVVVCTKTSIIASTCKALKWEHGNFFRLKDEVMFRLNAKTGEFVSKHTFKVMSDYQSANQYYGREDWGGNYSRPESVTSVAKATGENQNVAQGGNQRTIAVVKEIASRVIGSVTKSSTSSGKDTTEVTTEKVSDPFYYYGEGYGGID